MVCVFIDLLKGLIHILLKSLDIFIIVILKSVSCVSAVLNFSGPSVVGLLCPGKDILS